MPSLTRDEYANRRHSNEQREAKKAESLRALTMLSQSAVKAKTLTGHPAWDAYLEYLQAFVEQTGSLGVQYQQKLNDPLTVGHDDMLRAKIGLAECAAMTRALTAAMELPKDIVENGAKAKSMIERMKEAEEVKAA